MPLKLAISLKAPLTVPSADAPLSPMMCRALLGQLRLESGVQLVVLLALSEALPDLGDPSRG